MKKPEVYNDSYQNWKKYLNKKAQLVIADPPYCYDSETECFTRNGWKRFDEITMDDEVLSLNHETQEICYSGISNIIIQDNTDKMYSFESMHLNLMVTSKHRCYSKWDFKPNLKFGKRLRNRQRTITENIRLAEDITASAYIPRSGYVWKPNDITPQYVTIPSCEWGMSKYSSKIVPEVQVELDAWLRFFGLWLADGCTSKVGSGYCVSVKQFGEKRIIVKEIMEALPFKLTEEKEKSRESSNFNFYSKQLYLYLLPFGKSRDKYIPRWILDLPTDKLQIFWDAYTFGDSHKNGDGIKISSVSQKLIEGLQEVALKLGTICQVRFHKVGKNSDVPLYNFQFNPNSRNIAYHNKKEINDYNGKVWCLTLKTNSVFLVRRKGLIAFSGNSLGANMYASNPMWYEGNSNKNGESKLAGKAAFDSDFNFHPAEFMHFCSDLLVKEPKEQGKAPCMVLFCNWEHQFEFVELGKRYGFKHYIPLVFRKDYSPQVLKANMKVVGNCEYGLILYKEKLPKFNNNGQMVFNCMEWGRDNSIPKIHPTQKSYPLIKRLIELFTDPGDVVIDPVCGSGVALRAAYELGREAYGFEIKKEFCKAFNEKMMANVQTDMFINAQLEDMEKERQAKIAKYQQGRLEI